MKEINKLVHLINGGLKSNFDVIDLSGEIENPGKEQQLYNGVLNGTFLDDEITAQGMYDTDVYDQRFRMLKSRLRYKLYDLLYHLDFETPAFNFKTQKILECKEYLHKANILFELGELDMAEKQFNKVLVIGNDCQFTTEMIEAMELRRKMLAKQFKPTDFEQTIKELKELRNKKLLEDEAEDLFLKAELLLSKSIHSRNSSVSSTAETIAELEEIYAKTQSYEVFDFIYQLKIWHLLLTKDFEVLIKYLTKVASGIKDMSINEDMFDANFNNLLIAKCYLILEKYSKGIEIIESSYNRMDKSVAPWFEHAEMHFVLTMRNKDYQESLKILKSVQKNPNLNKVDEKISNRWKLFKLYLNYAAPHLGIQKRVRFSDIYSALDSYYIESKGYKVSMLIIEFLHALKDGLGTADYKMDRIDNFYQEELNDPGKYGREKQFYKLLSTLRKSNYNVEDTISKGELYLVRMSEKKQQNAFADPEIIPYEDLWNMMCSALKTRTNVMS